jgi:integrase
MPIPRWLETEWQDRLLPVLTEVQVQEANHGQCLQAVFEDALTAWRARPAVRSANTLATYVTLTREWVRSLPLTPHNQVINPITQHPEHVALTYFTLTPEQWAAGKSDAHHQVQVRNEQILALPHPLELLETIDVFLEHVDWEVVAAVLAAATGRRVGEVLLSGSLEPKTRYSVLFRGRLKLRGRPDQVFEIPTIGQAERVLAAWDRLHMHPALQAMALPVQHVTTQTLGRLNAQLYPLVRQAATHVFGELVPALDTQGAPAELSTHRLRSVYAALAVWLYCPVWVDPDRYAAAVLGHGLFSKDGVERLNPSTEEYYHRYVVADGRRGVRLGEPGVVVLERFQRPVTAEDGDSKPTPDQPTQPTETKPSTKKRRHEPARQTKTGFSSLRPKVQSRWEIYLIARDLGIEWKPDDEVLQVLIQTYHAHQQSQHQPPSLPPASSELTPAQLDVRPEEAERISHAMRLAHVPSFAAFVRQALERESKRVVNLAKTVQAKRDQELETVPTSQLEHVRRAPEANERLRRAIATIVDFNEQCPDPTQLWFVNQKVLRDLTGAAPAYINRMLEANQEYLRQHHTRLGITAAHNRLVCKRSIREVLALAEDPSTLMSLPALITPSPALPQDEATYEAQGR